MRTWLDCLRRYRRPMPLNLPRLNRPGSISMLVYLLTRRLSMIKKYLAALAATALTAAPVVAAPANPAASLSLSKSVRTGATAHKKSDLAGGGLLIAILASVAVVVGIVVVADGGNSDSN